MKNIFLQFDVLFNTGFCILKNPAMVFFPSMNLISIVNSLKTHKLIPLTLAGSLLFIWSASAAYAAPKQELQGVKSEITRQRQQLENQSQKLDELQNSLKKQELEISSLEVQIAQTKKKLATSNGKIQQLEKKITDLEVQKKQQSETLKKLIYTYYVTHNNHSASSILQDNSDSDRVSQYYQSLAKARADVIQALKNTQEQLTASETTLRQEKAQISQLLASQTQRHASLKKSQNSRRSTVNKIQSSISSDKQYLAELQRNESRLKAEIAKAAKRNAEVTMSGFGHQKGKLPWPVEGRVLHQFGSHQTGEINWKGVVISANYGQQIKAVYPGTVVFASYLRGYGLVILLDHGKGDMTLYGFNQSLLKKEGDKVQMGEPIALAGDTGGQSQPSLYFEVRRNSAAQNPLAWLKRN